MSDVGTDHPHLKQDHPKTYAKVGLEEVFSPDPGSVVQCGG